MTKFFVNIIESPSDRDFYCGRSEGSLIKTAVELNEITCYSSCTISKKMFIHALEYEFPKRIIKHINIAPILHISAHGFDNGIGLSNGDKITWAEIKDILSPYSAALHDSMLLCMSSCRGLSACQITGNFDKKTDPFFAVIGHFGSPTWSDTAIAYATLYHLLSKGMRPNDAVKAMQNASGDTGFQLITSSQIQQISLKALENITVDDINAIIERYLKSQEQLPPTYGCLSSNL